MIVRDLEITPKMARVLGVFLEDPAEPRYGLELIRRTGTASGSLYPMLARLKGAGWLTCSKEDIDPYAEGRPARVLYTLADPAAVRGKLQALSDTYRPPC